MMSPKICVQDNRRQGKSGCNDQRLNIVWPNKALGLLTQIVAEGGVGEGTRFSSSPQAVESVLVLAPSSSSTR